MADVRLEGGPPPRRGFYNPIHNPIHRPAVHNEERLGRMARRPRIARMRHIKAVHSLEGKRHGG